MQLDQRPRGAPGWRELRQHRIAQQQAEREQRKIDRLRPRPKSRDDDDDDEPQQRGPRPSPAPRQGKASAVVGRETLRKQRGGIERAAAWLVLLVSFAGSVATLHGGFAPMIESIATKQYNVGALLGGVLIQVVLTFLEWWYFDRPLIAGGARLVDAATTAIGFGPLFLAPLVSFLEARGIESPLLPAWGIIIAVSFAVAWFPESRLVD